MKTPLLPVLILILSAFMQATAMAVMKKHAGKKAGKKGLPMMLAALLFGASFPLYASGLSTLSLGIAQPAFSAAMFVATVLLSALVFKEKISAKLLSGIGLIVSGIAVTVL